MVVNWLLERDAMRKPDISRQRMSVCPSVRYIVYCIETDIDHHPIFSRPITRVCSSPSAVTQFQDETLSWSVK